MPISRRFGLELVASWPVNLGLELVASWPVNLSINYNGTYSLLWSCQNIFEEMSTPYIGLVQTVIIELFFQTEML